MESVDNPWGCGISTGGGKKLCLCLFCIKAAESGWAAGKNPGHPRRTGGRKMQERRRPVQAGRRRGARRVQEAAPYRHPGPRDRAAKGRSYRGGEIFWDGRVRTPAPTKFGESSGFSVGADDLGGPRAHSVRPYREKEAHLECSLGEGIPPPLRGIPLCQGGPCGRGISGGLFLCSKSRLLRGHPHPSGLRPATFPLEGGRLAGG